MNRFFPVVMLTLLAVSFVLGIVQRHWDAAILAAGWALTESLWYSERRSEARQRAIFSRSARQYAESQHARR